MPLPVPELTDLRRLEEARGDSRRFDIRDSESDDLEWLEERVREDSRRLDMVFAYFA